MQSTKPYLIRALHEWCVDQGLTPYLSVAVDATTRVPHEFVKKGEIVLNVGLEATNQLHLGNEEITFQGRFGGRVFPVVVPITRVAAIYARENNQGMAFEVTTDVVSADKRGTKSSGPLATVASPKISTEKGGSAVSPSATAQRAFSARPPCSAVDSSAPSSDGLKTFAAPETPEHPPPTSRPSLRRIK